MPTTILHGETQESALHRRCVEEAAEYEDDGTWPCSGKGCEGRVDADGDLCEPCEADRAYYAHDNDGTWDD